MNKTEALKSLRDFVALRPTESQLVEFFNTSDGYIYFGWTGDEKGWTPFQTAAYFLAEGAYEG